ncbi:Winged helix-turn-helix transcription repressor DNA-binding [Penicillium argentinense]|uniref:Winged helix-turn-helix transcription repressor DNA-binding n=1 Tax=Penicillium argentinense TaxID=1131581 RepID=A0A9W9FF26_9EURO|nr:Winged helix-turn-helix transcription repressor DNA-binding [Penicillium argentinense]KAJ5098994.1 Winged helix-turn-helix transcription repressor DNA-binding [Penicillium argentinense]
MSATFSYAQAAKGSSGPSVTTKTVPTEVQNTEFKPEDSSNDATPESVTTASEAETPKETEKSTPTETKDDEFTTVTSKSRTKALHPRNSSSSVRSSTKESKESDSSNTANGKAESSSEKKSQTDAKTEKSENAMEGSKDKSEKTDKTEKAEKAEKDTPPKELKAAPLPSVNIWQQRKEAQELKAKTTPPKSTGKTEENQQDSNRSNSKKKGTDGQTEGSKAGKKTEGGKGRDEALPPVGDASLWPTPEVAIGEEKKKAQEKTDKTEKTEKVPVARTHGKEKWTPVDFVPNAVFNTPLPQSGRGGARRSARGGREGGRGGAHAAGDKSAAGQAHQGATAKQAGGERGRNEAGSGRAASLPAQSHRSASADVNNSEGRKAQGGERGRGRATEDAAAVNGKQSNENAGRPQKQMNKNNNAQNSKNPNLAVDSQAAARATDRRTESGSKSADPTGFSEFNRGGRANNRGGRGPYSSFAGQNSQFGNPANSGFVPKSFGFNEQRQRSHNGFANGNGHQGNRMPMRSPSLPASGNMYNPYTYPGDMNAMYGYQPMGPAPMNVPFQPAPGGEYISALLVSQMEYYFSVDNMCKDMFLRRRMDSQGWVPLTFVADFKRIRSLTDNLEWIRFYARQLQNAEYQIFEDGVDRMRVRENWAQWVLPTDQRHPSAQHEGAVPVNSTGNADENVPFNAPSGAIPNARQPSVHNDSAYPRASHTLSSTAPEFKPSAPMAAQQDIANVGYHPALQMSPGCYLEGSVYDPSFTGSRHGPHYYYGVNEFPARGLNPNTPRFFHPPPPSG